MIKLRKYKENVNCKNIVSKSLKGPKYDEKYIIIGIFVSKNPHNCTFEFKVRIDCLVDRKKHSPKVFGSLFIYMIYILAY